MMILMIVYKSGNGEDDDGDYFDQGMPRQLQTSSGPDLLQTSHSSPSNSPKCQNVGNKTSTAATIKISFWNLIAKFENHNQGALQTNSQKWGPLQIAIRQSCVWSQEKKTLNMALQPTRLVIITPKRHIPPLQQITYSKQKIHKSKRIFGKPCSHVKWSKKNKHEGGLMTSASWGD